MLEHNANIYTYILVEILPLNSVLGVRYGKIDLKRVLL